MQIGVSNKRYICFNSNGEIEKISRLPDNILDNIEVNFEDIKELMSGKEALLNYKVEYDFIDKKYILKNHIQQHLDNTVGNFLYELPQNEKDFEIQICQNISKQCWQIEINQDFFDELNQTPNIQNMFFSITKKGDPNILYRMLKFENREIPFKHNFEFDKTPVSIYTVKKYSKYNYEVIDV